MTEFDDRPVREPRPEHEHAGTSAAAPVADARAQRDREIAEQLPAEPAKSGSRTAGIWIALILGAIVLALLLIFVMQNQTPAAFTYFSATFRLPLGIAMLLAAVAGALVMGLVGSVRIIQMSWELRRLRKNQAAVRDLVRGR